MKKSPLSAAAKESLIFIGIGFVATLLALEIGWHFTACSVNDKTMKPCLFKKIKLTLMNI
jgi:hypothetical protein